jgi:hypothetical protein
MSVIRCGSHANGIVNMLRKGVMPMPPAMNTAGTDASGWSVNEPAGPRTSTEVPRLTSARLRFMALPVIRVATRNSPVSCGVEAIENVRRLPPASV